MLQLLGVSLLSRSDTKAQIRVKQAHHIPKIILVASSKRSDPTLLDSGKCGRCKPNPRKMRMNPPPIPLGNQDGFCLDRGGLNEKRVALRPPECQWLRKLTLKASGVACLPSTTMRIAALLPILNDIVVALLELCEPTFYCDGQYFACPLRLGSYHGSGHLTWRRLKAVRYSLHQHVWFAATEDQA
jgi:hypothetical protein